MNQFEYFLMYINHLLNKFFIGWTVSNYKKWIIGFINIVLIPSGSQSFSIARPKNYNRGASKNIYDIVDLLV